MTIRAREQKSAVRAALIACAIGAFVSAGDIWASLKTFDVWFLNAALIDFAIVAYGTLLVLKLQRNLAIGAVFVLILFVGGTVGMIGKYALTWTPVSLGDLLLLPDLFG